MSDGPRWPLSREEYYETEADWIARRDEDGAWVARRDEDGSADDLDPAEAVFNAAPRVIRCVLCGEMPGQFGRCGCDREQDIRGERY